MPEAPQHEKHQPNGLVLWLAALFGVGIDDRFLSNPELDSKAEKTINEVVPRLREAQAQLAFAQEEIDAIIDALRDE